MFINECCAIDAQIEKGKPALGLTSLNCNCVFFHHGFDVYMHHELDLDMPVSRLTEAKNAIINR
ncbi:hypothetical protein C1645_834507 [Glomus cerebriforme]|uniref:Uncharacterized protein n=1 Tax=Glomus cerebriforme TaxID=658196 RepID=A0A397SE09_9GLOM|nr:hypothetical protein C1645_834507 [Glomus cerebriforme]